MPEINTVPANSPITQGQIPLSARQRLLAAELLSQQASKETGPVYSPAIPIAKGAAGLFGGIMQAQQAREIEDQQRAAASNLQIPLNGGGGAVPPGQAAPPSGGASANSMPSSASTPSNLSGINPHARGMQNNNPGNLESNAWTQKLPGYVGTDGRFAKFDTLDNGMAALDRNLQGYGAQGLNTPASIIAKWSPPGESGSNSAAYGNYTKAVAAGLGIGPNDTINMSDPSVRGRVAAAIARFENGAAPPTQTAANLPAPGATPNAGTGLPPGVTQDMAFGNNSSPSVNGFTPNGSSAPPSNFDFSGVDTPSVAGGPSPSSLNPQAMAADMQPTSNAIASALGSQGQLPGAGGNGAPVGPGDWGSPAAGPIPNASPGDSASAGPIPSAPPTPPPSQLLAAPQGPLPGDFGAMGSGTPDAAAASGLAPRQAALAAALAQAQPPVPSPDSGMPDLGPSAGGQGAPLGPGDLGSPSPVPAPSAPPPQMAQPGPPPSPDTGMPNLPGPGGPTAPLGPGDLGAGPVPSPSAAAPSPPPPMANMPPPDMGGVPNQALADALRQSAAVPGGPLQGVGANLGPASDAPPIGPGAPQGDGAPPPLPPPSAPPQAPNANLAAALAQYRNQMPAPSTLSSGPGPIASDQPQGNVAPNIPMPPPRPANLGAPPPSAANLPAPGASNAGPNTIPAPIPRGVSPQMLAAVLAQTQPNGPTMTGRTNNSAQTPTQFNLAQAANPKASLLAALLGAGNAPPSGVPSPTPGAGVLTGAPPPAPSPAPMPAGGAPMGAPTPTGSAAPSPQPSPSQSQGFNPYANVPNSVIQQYNALVSNPYASPQMIEAAQQRIAAYMPRAVPDNSVMYNPGAPSGQQFTTMPIPHKYDASRNGIIYDQSTGQVANGGANNAPLTKVMSPDEVKTAGLPPGSYQRNSITNEVSPISSPAGNDANTYAEPLVKSVGDYHASLAAGVPQAQANVRAYNAMQGALQRLQAAGGTTGFGAEELKDLKSAINTGANVLGITPPNDISNQEEMASFGRTLAGGIAKSVGGARVTNFEMKNFLEANPGLDLSPQGNQRLIGIGAQIEQRKADIGGKILDMTTQAMQNGQRPNAAQVQEMIKSYDADPTNHIRDPITGQDLTQNYKLAPAGSPPAPAAPQQGAVTPPQGAPSAPPAAAAPSAPAAPPVGTVQKGHVFLGGDPSSPASWGVVRQ